MTVNFSTMKKILVPCDFSESAIHAFRFALDAAALSNGTVHLLNVIELPAMPNTAFTPVRLFGMPLMKEMSAKAQNNFDKMSTKYASGNVKVVKSVEFGVPSKVILDHVKKNLVDVIIMGSHGASGLRDYFVGSNAEKIVRNSSVPVIVVKDILKGPVKNIVFPNTFEGHNQDDLVVKVKALQTFFKAHLHLVWINTPANFTPDTVTLQRLTAFAKRFTLKDFTINVFNHLTEEEGIIHYTKAINGDLIAMGTHGRKGLSHMMSGSMAEDVASQGKSLIWTYLIKKRKR